MPVNQDALNDAYTLFSGKGYGGSMDEFVNLIKTNSDALNDSYTLFTDAGYRGSGEEYIKLLGLRDEPKKEEVVEDEAVEETTEEPTEETSEEFDYEAEKFKTEEDLKKEDDQFYEAWKETNPDSELTREDVLTEKKKQDAKNEEEPTADVDTSDPIMKPYLMDEEQLVSQPSSTAVPQLDEGEQEERTRRGVELENAENQALIDLNNYKEKNRHQFKEVTSNYEPNFPTPEGNITLAPIGSTITKEMNEKLMMNYIKNNKEVQEVIIPSLYTDNQKAIENKIQELRSKYGDGTNFYSKADYEEAQGELNAFVSGFLFDNPRYIEIVNDYANAMNKLHFQDDSAYQVDKNTPEWLKSLEKISGEGTGLSPMSFYNTMSSMFGTGYISIVSKMRQTYDWQPRYEKHQRNLQKAEQQGWSDDMVGCVDNKGNFRPETNCVKRLRRTWGEAKKETQRQLNQDEALAKRDLMIILERRAKEGAFRKANFNNFASGENSLQELGLMISEQVPNMVAALFSFGAIPAINEGSRIYEDLVRKAAVEKYNIPENEEPTPQQMYQVIMDDTENKMSGIASQSTIAIAGLEYIGARAMMPVFDDAIGSLLKGQFKRSLKGLVNTGQRMATGGVTEGLTEGLQTAVSSLATGHWDADEFVEAIGMGTTMGIIMPFGGSVITQTSRELSESIKMVANKYDKRVADKMFANHQSILDDALKNGKIDIQEHKEKTEALTSVRNSNNKIPKNLNEKEKTEAIDLLIEKETIEKETEGKDKNLVVKQNERIEAIDNRLQQISSEAQLRSVKVIAGQVEKETGKKVNIRKGNTKDQQAFLEEQEIDEIQFSKGVVNFMKEVIADPTSTKEEVAEAKAILKAQRKGDKKRLNIIKGGSTNYGSMIPVLNEKGEVESFEMFINEETSMQDGMLNTAAHEMLHAMLFATLKGDVNAQMTFGEGILSAMESGGMKVKPGSNLAARMRMYSPNEGLGEEVGTLTSEAMLNDEVDVNETGYQILGSMFRRFAQKHLGVVGGIRFNNNQQMFNFLKDYNKSIEEGKGLNKAMLKAFTKGIGGKLMKGSKEAQAQVMASKSGFAQPEVVEDLGLGNNTADIVARNKSIEEDIIKEGVKDNDGNIIASPANQRRLAENNLPRAFALARQAADKGNTLTLEEGLKMNDVMEFFSEYSLKLTELARTYKARMADGTQVPFGAYMNSLLPLKYSGILDKLKSKVETASMTDETTAKKVAKRFASNTELSNREVEGKIVALNSINENKVQKQLVKIAKGIEALGGLRKYKDVKSELVAHNKPKKKSDRKPTGKLYEALEAVSEGVFGVEASRILQEKDLNTEQRKSAQDKILQYTPEIIAMMPFGTTASGDATGVANTKLGMFYKKLARTKMKNTGTGKGLATQQKQDIDPTKFRELVGLVKGGRINNTSVDGAIRAIIVQVATIASNQAIRQTHGPQTLSLKDGKASRMWSRRQNKKLQEDGSVETDMSVLMLRENVDYKILLQAQIDGFVKDGLMTRKEAEETYGAIDMNSEEGRADMLNWVYNNMSNYMPWSFFNHTGNWTGTFTTIKIDDILKKEWRQKQDNYSVKSFKKPYADLTKDQKKVIDNKMAKDNWPGEITEKKHKGNLLFKDAVELKEAQQAFIDSGAAWNGENISEQDKVDIENALKRVTQNEKNLKDKELRASKKRGVKLIWGIFEQMVEDNPGNLKYIAALLSSSASQQGHFMRTGSDFAFLNTLSGKNVEEHTQAATAFGRFLFSRLAEGTLSENIDIALESYFQGSLPKIYDDKLKGKNWSYQKDAGRYTWGILTGRMDVWVRYFNPDVNNNNGGIDPNVIILSNGNTLAQEYGVNIDGEVTPEILKLQQETLFRLFSGEIDIQDARLTMEALTAVKRSPDMDQAITLDKAMKKGRVLQYASKRTKGITVLDFDDTLATTKSRIRYTKPDGSKGSLNAEEYARDYVELSEQGYQWDFSEFNKVVGGKLAPLFQKALKLQRKFGPENMFVLTARPAAAQQAIFEFLKANGLNIPLRNITGLGNSTAEAKALWMADKVAEGYNDFYFADDALQNVQAVQNMLDQFDVKSKVQQAKVKFRKRLNPEFNKMLERTTGVESQKIFSDAQARIRGRKTKYKSIIPASAQDFQGLLYSFLGKGKQGEADMAFFKQALIDPFSRGINELNASKQNAANDFEKLNKAYPKIKKALNKNIGDSVYTNDQAIRVYLWNKAGFEIPGLSLRDLNMLTNAVENNAELKAYADNIGLISKKDMGYSAPSEYWLAESIASDLLSDGSIGVSRAEFLAEWIQNKNEIFSPENLNKIEAIYGSNFREALEDILYRMENGTNRPTGRSRLVNNFMNWTNNSVGAIMFLNLRSATLQTISAVNYVNWSDNNIYQAGKAFANQKQFWKDFSFIFNSDYLKQRRSGNQRGINEAELSEAVANSTNKAKAAIAWLLKKGFKPTQIADSFAISMGGAGFYRNRLNSYLKQGMTQAEAEAQAFLDFQEITEVNQQSARPDMISQQQASPLGRLILAFQNTPMQYARIMNKSARDLVNGRGDYRSHISRIVYYGFVQSIIFGALQSALYASLGDEDEEDFDRKKERIINQMIDTWLTGIGYGGKAIGTVKNTIMEYLKQRDKGFRANHAYTILQLLGFSPPIGSKVRKIYSGITNEQWNKEVYMRRGFTLDNPIWSAVGNVIEGVTNAPFGRLANIMLQLDNIMDPSHKWWQRVALLLGQNTWDLGIKDPDIEAIKVEVRAEKREASKEKARIKKEEKKREKEEENQAIIEENKKKNDGRCAAISKGGKRCKKKAVNGGFCTVHEEKEQMEGGKTVQCKKIKSDGARCKMQTSNKSGYCYYHD